MSDDKKRDRALQRRVRERQAKTGESYQAAWRHLTGDESAETAPLLNPHRLLLPLSTEVPILPGRYAQITAHPQVTAFCPDRLLIKNAESWTIEQLTVESKRSDSKHSLIETSSSSGAAFSSTTWHPLVPREVLCGQAIVLVVTYRGSDEKGERFEAALFGWEDHLPAKDAKRSSAQPGAKRISERAVSQDARAAETIKLP